MKKMIGLLFLVCGVAAGYYFYGMKPPTSVEQALLSFDKAKFSTMSQYYISLAGAGLVFVLGVMLTLRK